MGGDRASRIARFAADPPWRPTPMTLNDRRVRFLKRSLALPASFLAAGVATAGDIKTVFYIEMENHNLTQPSSLSSPQQLMGNPAAPYLNSLMTPGNPNAAQTSWASNYLNAAPGVHPSLPNYL